MQERCWSLISLKVTASLSIFLNFRKTLLWLLLKAIASCTGRTKRFVSEEFCRIHRQWAQGFPLVVKEGDDHQN
ncbi:hypothetical protein COCON_G00001220 [Conger conger]|uniref:Uncharacterized protein n=1 Tax=Conger conger TaxID=82655 RepID=A0A9Q1E0L9_CONCO|nr:hypothetical protein COCON_G00001220 [Conger conger]